MDKDEKYGLARWALSTGIRPDGLEVKELTEERIADIIAAYGKYAEFAKREGFEMVMIHGGHS